MGFFCNIYGQKVKVKRGVLLINKEKVGFFLKKKIYQGQKQFLILNNKRDTVFVVGREVIFSKIDGEDEIYLHEILSVPSSQVKNRLYQRR